MKRFLTTLAVTGVLALACSVASAQTRYTPPGTSPGGGSTTPTNTTPPPDSTTPTAHNPDPTGLTLAFFGAAAAVGYVMRRKRSTA